MTIINQIIKCLIIIFPEVHREESLGCKIVVQYLGEDEGTKTDNGQIVVVRYTEMLGDTRKSVLRQDKAKPGKPHTRSPP